MKLALLIAFAPDRRSGRVLGDVVPADKAIATVKAAIAAGTCPDARFPNLAAVSLSDILRQHRFQVSAADVAEASKALDANVLVPSNFIPVQIGEGEQAVIVNVTTDEEAAFLNQMADAMKGSIAEIERLRTANVGLNKAAEGMETANQRLATYEADLKAKAEALERADIRIRELEAQLENAKASKKSK